jgi:hypothetical protein
MCSNCSSKFDRGVTRVRRFIVFHFCRACHIYKRAECERVMDIVSGQKAKAAAA